MGGNEDFFKRIDFMANNNDGETYLGLYYIFILKTYLPTKPTK
jgi:hypothetical protein